MQSVVELTTQGDTAVAAAKQAVKVQAFVESIVWTVETAGGKLAYQIRLTDEGIVLDAIPGKNSPNEMSPIAYDLFTEHPDYQP